MSLHNIKGTLDDTGRNSLDAMISADTASAASTTSPWKPAGRSKDRGF